jgi:hypothetical protein
MQITLSTGSNININTGDIAVGHGQIRESSNCSEAGLEKRKRSLSLIGDTVLSPSSNIPFNVTPPPSTAQASPII